MKLALLGSLALTATAALAQDAYVQDVQEIEENVLPG